MFVQKENAEIVRPAIKTFVVPVVFVMNKRYSFCFYGAYQRLVVVKERVSYLIRWGDECTSLLEEVQLFFTGDDESISRQVNTDE